jgi:hypothetical protein
VRLGYGVLDFVSQVTFGPWRLARRIPAREQAIGFMLIESEPMDDGDDD